MDKIDLHILILKIISTALQLVITIIILALVIVFTYSSAIAADLPEYADLTFTNQADLDARMDSVLLVCDTVRVDSSAALCAYGDTTIWFIYPRLLCRRFAGLTIMWMPKREIDPQKYADWLWDSPIDPRTLMPDTEYPPDIWRDISGKVRLWWWEKEE